MILKSKEKYMMVLSDGEMFVCVLGRGSILELQGVQPHSSGVSVLMESCAAVTGVQSAVGFADSSLLLPCARVAIFLNSASLATSFVVVEVDFATN